MGASRQFGLGSKRRPDLVQLAVRLSPDTIGHIINPEPARAFCIVSINIIKVLFPPIKVTPQPARAYCNASADRVVLGSIAITPQTAAAYTEVNDPAIEILKTPIEITPSPATAYGQVVGPTVSINAVAKILTAVGGARLDSSSARFGLSSGFFAAYIGYPRDGIKKVTTPAHSHFNFGISDFTIDFWFRISREFLNNSGSVARVVVGLLGAYNNGPDSWECSLVTEPIANGAFAASAAITFTVINASPAFTIRLGGGSVLPRGDAFAFSPGPWRHYAIAKHRGIFFLFLDGRRVAVVTSRRGQSIADMTEPIQIGHNNADTDSALPGHWRKTMLWMDELRVSGSSRQIVDGPLSPHRGPYERDSETRLLMHFDPGSNSQKFIDSI